MDGPKYMVKEKKEELIGKITHYFDKIEVGIIEIGKGKLAVGDEIHVKGAITDFEQEIESMQIEHEQVKTAKKGDAIGLKVKDKVREGDEVYKK
jgi:translation elongation factor EF-1alpha